MFSNLSSICRNKIPQTHKLNTNRSFIKPRNPPQINFTHSEYTILPPPSSTSFTSPILPSQSNPLSRTSNFKLFSFPQEMITRLKAKSSVKCSSFEAVVAHLWRSRTKSVFENPTEKSSVLFAVDIRSKISPGLPEGYIGNAVITACASAEAGELGRNDLSFCVGKVREAIERVSDEYVRSVVDWLEVFKGVPCALNGSFFVSAWWKLPFHELDFGFGRALYGGPVVSCREEFVLLLSDGRCGINVWIALDEEKMERFQTYVFEI